MKGERGHLLRHISGLFIVILHPFVLVLCFSAEYLSPFRSFGISFFSKFVPLYSYFAPCHFAFHLFVFVLLLFAHIMLRSWSKELWACTVIQSLLPIILLTLVGPIRFQGSGLVPPFWPCHSTEQ